MAYGVVMMEINARRQAALLAATEVVPGEWRDLADLIDRDGLDWLERDGTPLAERGGLADHLLHNIDEGRVEHWLKVLDRLAEMQPDVWLVTVPERSYPANLRTVYNRPPFLFVEGTLNDRDARAVAIVGSRRASDHALQTAFSLAHELAIAGVTIVSGLADGIDTAAHRGALDTTHGRTLAVLGTGIDRTFPEHNASLARKVTARGALVSQFRPGSPPTRSTFPMRNAVISGLSRASLLVEASERSGTRSEAEHSLRQGRPVLLWAPLLERQPWARDFVHTRDGASFVSSADDVLRSVDAIAPHPQLT